MVTDGLSNTTIIGEDADLANLWQNGVKLGPSGSSAKPTSARGVSGGPGRDGGIWNDWQMGSPQLRNIVPGSATSTGSYTKNGPCTIGCYNQHNLYSFHPGGAQVLMGDGSARMLSNNTDMNTVARLMVRNDGQVIGDF
jgi:prepilin-type processing-associated H-X9-DG protein